MHGIIRAPVALWQRLWDCDERCGDRAQAQAASWRSWYGLAFALPLLATSVANTRLAADVACAM